MKTYLAENTNCKLLGRAYFMDDILWMAYSGSGAEFIVNGTKAEVTLLGDSIAVRSDMEKDYVRFAIYLDGERIHDECLREASKTVCIFEGTQQRSAVVTVLKLSEAAMSTMAIQSISVDDAGSLLPTPKKEKLIEFIGDSITCGYGVDDEDKDHHFSTETEDVTKAYAYKTAKKLGVDYSLVSLSGYGIISGYTDNGTKIPQQIIPPYYDKIGYSRGFLNGKTPESYSWDFTARQPELVVINLGTNDFSYCQSNEERGAEFTTEYVKFLHTVRAKNPKAYILCVLGTMAEEFYCRVEAAVKQYKGEAGDANISSFGLKQHTEADGYAADWHPSEYTHEKTAEILAAEIQILLNR